MFRTVPSPVGGGTPRHLRLDDEIVFNESCITTARFDPIPSNEQLHDGAD